MSAPTVKRDTPTGTAVEFDIAPYPAGYAWGAEPTGETARGTLHAVEGDAGIDWCFVRIDPRDRGDGGEYRHVPMDRTRVAGVTPSPSDIDTDERQGRMTHEELIDLFPEGRTFYDETDDTEAFVKTCHGMGLTTSTHYPPPDNADGLTPWTTVHVPARLLFDFYALNLRVGT